MYDPVIGRFTIIDPYREFWSPYVGLGNNPVNLVDPTGGMTDPPTQYLPEGAVTVTASRLSSPSFGFLDFNIAPSSPDIVWHYMANFNNHDVYDVYIAFRQYAKYEGLATGAAEPFYIGNDLTDVVEAGANLAEGNYLDAGLSAAAAALPFVSWKSVKFFGHSFLRHGAGKKVTLKLTGRAARTGVPQGQWLDNEMAARLLQDYHGDGPFSILKIPDGLGQVVRPDGTVVPATRAVVIPTSNGIKTAFPIE